MQQALAKGGPSTIAVIGGARGTNEDAYAWAKLAKGVLGTDHVDAQLGDGLDPAVAAGPAQRHDRRGLPRPPTVVLLGPDLKEELPVLYLRLRDAAEKRRTRLVELASHDTGLTPYTWKSLRHRPGEQAALVRSLLDPARPAPDGTGCHRRRRWPTSATSSAKGNVVVVVAGGVDSPSRRSSPRTPSPCCTPRLPAATFLAALRRGNVNGALDIGLVARAPAGWRHAGRGAGDDLRARWPSLPAGARPRHRPASCGPPPTAASPAWCCSAPTRSPTSPTATSPCAPSTAPARSSRSTRSSTTSSRRADVVLAAAGLRREGRHHDQPRRSGQHASASRSRRSAPPTPTGSSPPTWPHRLGHDLGLGLGRARSGTSSGRCRRATPRLSGDRARGRPRWRRDTARRGARSPSPTPDHRHAAAEGLRAAPVGRPHGSTTPASPSSMSPSLRRARRRQRAAPEPVGRRPPRRAPTAPPSRSESPRATAQLPDRPRRGRAPGRGLGGVEPARRGGQHPRSTPATPSTTSRSPPCPTGAPV